jgi:TRAP-type mannitol/chloroaromatic compound transport system permease small subunit
VGGLLKLSRTIDRVNLAIGRAASWLILAAVLVSSVNALVRKLFDLSSNAWLELQWVLFSAVFMLCGAWALLANEHVRIDIVNSRLSGRTRNIIDVVGHVAFLFPMCLLMLVTSWPFFVKSLSINEQSASAGGLPQWPAKALIFAGFALVLAQGASELIKRIAIMRGLLSEAGRAGGDAPTGAADEVARLLAGSDHADKR